MSDALKRLIERATKEPLKEDHATGHIIIAGALTRADVLAVDYFAALVESLERADSAMQDVDDAHAGNGDMATAVDACLLAKDEIQALLATLEKEAGR